MALTKKTLIEALKDFPDDMQVIMSKDGEGNNFSPLAEAAGPYQYTPDSTWSGEIKNEDDAEEGDEDDEPFVPNAIVLWPTN